MSLLLANFPLPQQQNPLWRDFFVSAGFGGVMALSAAIIAASAAIYAARRSTLSQRLDRQLRDEHHQQTLRDGIQSRTEEFRVAAIGRCWDRLVWLIQRANAEPATGTTGAPANLTIGPELADQLLQMLENDAVQLGDPTLARAVNVYLIQFGLVLAQQTGKHASVADL